MNFSNRIKSFQILFLLSFFVGSCTGQPSNVQTKPAVEAIKTLTPIRITPTNTLPKSQPPNQTIVITELDMESEEFDETNSLPNLWTRINRDKFNIFPRNYARDFTYDKDGGLWIVGEFGVIYKGKNGTQNWYSIKTGLLNNDFNTIALAPNSDVWIGGSDNLLFRYDGKKWIDEGINLPVQESILSYVGTYTREIRDIDFDKNGTIWILDSEFEFLTRINGRWVDFPIWKELLQFPYRVHPMGFTIKSENDITVKISTGVDGETKGFHWDGITWVDNFDYSIVDEKDKIPVSYPEPVFMWNVIQETGVIDWNVYESEPLPSNNTVDKLTTDNNGVIWFEEYQRVSNYQNGKFHEIKYEYTLQDWEIDSSQVLNFSDEVAFYLEGKKPYYLSDLLQEANITTIDNSNYSVDTQGRVWFYNPIDGLIVVDHGEIDNVSINQELSKTNIGGILPLRDGSILIGSKGVIWTYENNQWQRIVLKGVAELITNLVEGDDGIIYAASDTGVYRLSKQYYTFTNFVEQDRKPSIIQNDSSLAECSGGNSLSNRGCPLFLDRLSPKYHYDAVLLKILPDGSVIYINNHLIAKLKNYDSESYFFDTMEIESATIGKDGSIWINTGDNGLIQFSPDIFSE
jgi:ligand-binding sensor domain-containing protein